MEGRRDESGSRGRKLEFGVSEKRKRQAGERKSKAILKNQQRGKHSIKRISSFARNFPEYRKQKICPE
jgi:hypothetical protein